MKLRSFAVALIIASSNPGFAETRLTSPSLAELAHMAFSSNSVEAQNAIAQLRAAGPAGLQSLFDTHQAASMAGPGGEGWAGIAEVFDAVSGQRDSYASRLYWYTDLGRAMAAAKAGGKPILSLRLLGRLDEELSCANSRLFRITLYANSGISQYLRDHFILHWRSERPVPKVTIDFGNGRKLERTLTGNSIHYVLDAEGNPIDALPGLYGPSTFLQELLIMESTAKRLNGLDSKNRRLVLNEYHKNRITQVDRAIEADQTKLGIRLSPRIARAAGTEGSPPRAETAARVAVTKMVVIERPILRGISNDSQSLNDTADDGLWARVASLHAPQGRLDRSSKTLMMRKMGNDVDASLFDDKLNNLERAIAIDTVRNEYVFRKTIHEWFIRGFAANLEGLNTKVYDELFLTPASDPWLGLLPRGSYTGIEGEGVSR